MGRGGRPVLLFVGPGRRMEAFLVSAVICAILGVLMLFNVGKQF
jgi:hypothetical protein